MFLRVSASSNTFTDGARTVRLAWIAFGCHFIIDTIVKEVRRAIVGLLDRLIAHILIPFFSLFMNLVITCSYVFPTNIDDNVCFDFVLVFDSTIVAEDRINKIRRAICRSNPTRVPGTDRLIEQMITSS